MNRNGYTLIELIICVVGIPVLIAGIALSVKLFIYIWNLLG